VLRKGKPATRAEDLPAKAIGGRRDGGPRLTAKDIREIEKGPAREPDKKKQKKGK
jgi:hypothetical protein